jgi:hypothetical protein
MEVALRVAISRWNLFSRPLSFLHSEDFLSMPFIMNIFGLMIEFTLCFTIGGAVRPIGGVGFRNKGSCEVACIS